MEQTEHVATLQWPSVYVSVALFRGLKRWEGLSLAKSPPWIGKSLEDFEQGRGGVLLSCCRITSPKCSFLTQWQYLFCSETRHRGRAWWVSSSLPSWGNNKAGNGSHVKAHSLTCLVGSVGFTRHPRLDCTKPFHMPSWLPHKMVARFPRQAFQEREPGGSLYQLY